MGDSAFDTEAMRTGDPGTALAMEQGAQVLRPEPPKVASAKDYEALPHGAAYLDPEGKQRFKPIRDKNDYIAIEEGAEYADPTGTIRTKPKYEGIDFSPQYLYDIAHSDKGRKKALEKYYPGKVKEDPNGGFYIEDEDGKLRKPSRGLSKFTAGAASEAIPTIMSGGGSLIGGAVGSAVAPGPGTVAGGAAGGAYGGYMGSRINDIFSQLAGVYDEEGATRDAVVSGVAGAAGDLGGRALSAVLPAAKEAAGFIGRSSAKTANKLLGTDPQALETAVPIAEAGETPGGPFGLSKAGTEVSPSAVFKSTPHLVNVSETLAQKFDSSKNFLEHAEDFMDKRAKDILAHKDIGTIVQDSVVHPKAAVSTEEAGSLLKESARLRAVDQSAEADRQLAEALANRRAAVEAKHAPDIEAHRARNESVIKTATQAKQAADNLVNEGFQAIEKQANDAIRVAQVGHNAGDLWRTVAESFVGLRKSIGVRASKMYEDAETASGGLVPPGIKWIGASRAAVDRGTAGKLRVPAPVDRARNCATLPVCEDPKTGEWIKEPADATWVQLHNLRSQIRQDIKWNDLPSDIRNGTLKFLDGKINEVLHPVETGETAAVGRLPVSAEVKAEPFRPSQVPDPNAPPAYRVAIKDKGKKLFSATLSPWSGKYRINDIERVDPSAKGMGPAAYQKLAEFIRRQHNTELLSGVSGDTSPGAKAVQAKLQAAGLFDAESGPAGEARLRQQANYIQQLRGKMSIKPQPGDTANDIILRARAAAADAESLAKTDPLKAMHNEMRKVEAAVKRELAAGRKPDPLAFLNESTVGANKAVDRILGDPDLIVAASRAFPGGEKSSEFQLLRQVWTQRFLSETLEPGERLAATSKEIQELMFPGITLDDMHMLAKEMKLLMSGATVRGGDNMGGSMMAQSAVENPAGRISGLGKLAGPAKLIPGGNFAMRAVLTSYYNTVRGLLTSPSTLRWLRKGLTSRDPEAKAAARAELRLPCSGAGRKGPGSGRASTSGRAAITSNE